MVRRSDYGCPWYITPVLPTDTPSGKEVKDLIQELAPRYPNLKEFVFRGMQRLPLKEWAPIERCDRRPLPLGDRE